MHWLSELWGTDRSDPHSGPIFLALAPPPLPGLTPQGSGCRAQRGGGIASPMGQQCPRVAERGNVGLRNPARSHQDTTHLPTPQVSSAHCTSKTNFVFSSSDLRTSCHLTSTRVIGPTVCRALGRGLCRHSSLSLVLEGKYYHLCVSPMGHEAQRPEVAQLGSSRVRVPV